MVCAGQISPRVVARQRKSRDVRLGVKWSQVRILIVRIEGVLSGVISTAGPLIKTA